MKEYKFYKKIKPNSFIWCISMQASIQFNCEAWIGVVSEHTTCSTGDKKVFFGNIFLNETTGFNLTDKNIEFEVWEDTSTEGERYEDISDIPTHRYLWMDNYFTKDVAVSLIDCFLDKKKDE